MLAFSICILLRMDPCGTRHPNSADVGYLSKVPTGEVWPKPINDFFAELK